MAKITWARKALDDLRAIYEFIARDSEHYAGLHVERVFEAAGRLARFPEIGRSLPEFPELPHRELLIGDYRLIYRTEGDVVRVVAVVHGRRLIRKPPA
jgi:toxin ParE1/3/4